MFGLMQDQPLLIASIIRYAARHHGATEVVSRLPDTSIHRTTYAEIERRARRLARALQRLGVKDGDRVATLAWNSFRHLELYYAVSGMGAICHTVNPRLSTEDIAYILNHAQDCLLFADSSFVALLDAVAPQLTGGLRGIVMLCTAAEMPQLAVAPGISLLCYETLMAGADEDFAWPVFDERTASSLCYTSGTTGRPKGVLFSHRSTVLHAYAVNSAAVFGLRPGDRMLPVVPMFHVNAWGTPYTAPAAGAALIMPGRHLDGASLTTLMNAERVTVSAGVPTVWLGLLQHLRTSGERLATVRRLIIGGSTCPPALIEAFEKEYGIAVEHAWGMTETSPLGTFNTPRDIPGEDEAAALRRKSKQGHTIFGLDIRITDDMGAELPWDGKASGNLQIRGLWVCSAYYGDPPGSASDAEGWFTTGDVASVSPDGNMEITDRSKDVIKSGGEWISSILLENIAVSHPDVAEAAVVAADHPRWAERPVLIVVPKPERAIDPASVLARFVGQVPKYWMPDAVITLSELPHTATGKVSKLTLRQRFRRYLLDSQAGAPRQDA
ncbi:MAG: long-chain-fatty-acid--CoA ligase [Alphaproteobacteria bacterium]|nr:long-chain-fatty-acid--CoA ligase [Alphaproteobacteria bacterium]